MEWKINAEYKSSRKVNVLLLKFTIDYLYSIICAHRATSLNVLVPRVPLSTFYMRYIACHITSLSLRDAPHSALVLFAAGTFSLHGWNRLVAVVAAVTASPKRDIYISFHFISNLFFILKKKRRVFFFSLSVCVCVFLFSPADWRILEVYAVEASDANEADVAATYTQ